MSNDLTHGALSLNVQSGAIHVDDEAISLTSLEYRLLKYLMTHKNKVISKTELTEHLYDQDFDKDSNTIEVIVGRIRRKIKHDLIQTHRGLGYQMKPQNAP